MPSTSTSGPDLRPTAASARGAATGPPMLLVLHLRAADEDLLVVVGEADLASAGALRTALVDALVGLPAALRVHLGSLDFCDRAGVEALHAAEQLAGELGVPLHLDGMSRQLTWLHAVLPRRPRPERGRRSGPPLRPPPPRPRAPVRRSGRPA